MCYGIDLSCTDISSPCRRWWGCRWWRAASRRAPGWRWGCWARYACTCSCRWSWAEWNFQWYPQRTPGTTPPCWCTWRCLGSPWVRCTWEVVAGEAWRCWASREPACLSLQAPASAWPPELPGTISAWPPAARWRQGCDPAGEAARGRGDEPSSCSLVVSTALSDWLGSLNTKMVSGLLSVTAGIILYSLTTASLLMLRLGLK